MRNASRFSHFLDKAPAMIWVASQDGSRIHFNKRWLDFTGRPIQSELDTGWTEGIHPDDVIPCLRIYSESFDCQQEFAVEYRLRRHDGAYRWIHDTGLPWFIGDNSFAGYIGSCFDITESKLAARALEQAAGRLIEERDREDLRIAQELHRDIGASLGILGIELMKVGNSVLDSSKETYSDIQRIYEKIQEIGLKASRISSRLNPPMLKYFGLAKALEIECKEFSDRCQIPASCSCENIPPNLDPVFALNLFRVAQEALGNAGEHSHATCVAVKVTATSTDLILEVSDDGIGFDLEQAGNSTGLGLMRIRERMRLFKGDAEIRSQRGRGTKITCHAPLPH